MNHAEKDVLIAALTLALAITTGRLVKAEMRLARWRRIGMQANQAQEIIDQIEFDARFIQMIQNDQL